MCYWFWLFTSCRKQGFELQGSLSSVLRTLVPRLPRVRHSFWQRLLCLASSLVLCPPEWRPVSSAPWGSYWALAVPSSGILTSEGAADLSASARRWSANALSVPWQGSRRKSALEFLHKLSPARNNGGEAQLFVWVRVGGGVFLAACGILKVHQPATELKLLVMKVWSSNDWTAREFSSTFLRGRWAWVSSGPFHRLSETRPCILLRSLGNPFANCFLPRDSV